MLVIAEECASSVARRQTHKDYYTTELRFARDYGVCDVRPDKAGCPEDEDVLRSGCHLEDAG